MPKRYSMNELKLAWSLFKKKTVYRALSNGVWHTFFSMDEAKAKQPLKIEVKLAKDVMDFPVYLELISGRD